MTATLEERVLVVAPTGADAKHTVQVLEHGGFEAEIFPDVDAAVEAAREGCGVLVLTEESLIPAHRQVLRGLLDGQPTWSNIPLILITSGGAQAEQRSVRWGFDPRIHVTLLERPLRAITLVASVEAAMGSRQQQYAIRDLLEERQEILSSLEERVKERTASLQAMVREMEAFSYSVSHDLRSPLRVLSGYAEIVQEDYADKLPPEGHRMLGKISSAARRMDQLTQDLLAYTRIANTEIALEPIDLDAVLDAVIETYPLLQESREHIAVARPLGRCLGHAPSLEQCFSNLLENAVKFARPGEKPRIEVFSRIREGHLRASVLDHGIGIDPRDKERIFGMFERGGDDVPGTGIGLAIVRKGAERMKGRAGLICAPGRPTEFWLELNLPES